MNRVLATAVAVVLFCAWCAAPRATAADDDRSLDLTAQVRGVVCDRCADAVRDALNEVEGIRFTAGHVHRADGPKFTTEPFVIRIADATRTTLGKLALAVAKARTPHRDEVAPRLVLILHTNRPIDEDSVVALRSELMNVNGVDVLSVGGLGGSIQGRYYWVRLDDSDVVELKEVLKAAQLAGVPVSVKKQ